MKEPGVAFRALPKKLIGLRGRKLRRQRSEVRVKRTLLGGGWKATEFLTTGLVSIFV